MTLLEIFANVRSRSTATTINLLTKIFTFILIGLFGVPAFSATTNMLCIDAMDSDREMYLKVIDGDLVQVQLSTLSSGAQPIAFSKMKNQSIEGITIYFAPQTHGLLQIDNTVLQGSAGAAQLAGWIYRCLAN